MNERRRVQGVIPFIKELITRFIQDDVAGLSAQLAYYFLFSIFPFFIFAFTLLGYLPISTGSALSFVSRIAPESVTQLLETNLHQFINIKRGWLLVLALVGTLWSASSAITAIIYALDKAYNIKVQRPYWIARGMGILFTLAMVIAIFITLLLPVFGKAIERYATAHFAIPPDGVLLWNFFRWVFSLIFLVIIFAFLYFFAPNKKLKWRQVMPGAITAAAGWLVVSLGFSFYVNNFYNFTLTYGSLGGVIVLMMWFYFSGMIIIVGGQINAILNISE
ncbi:YihY/virulence factor BrkB family protein [Aneurinibacillus terranovensis]|uniref:YihY/virulence factor BrkB family protein n=1 Tax=Aneurinibacillus terranovensis TaxID=278991 RepID=UPI0004022829|nr:YihY/virulence factor BrkB family protein [Aneurinibacillus terranovensis]